MPLPPLANLLALRDPDPARLEATTARLQGDGGFATVWRPAPGWVAASAPLPGGEPDGAEVREAGFAFAEGRQALCPEGTDRLRRLNEVAGLVDGGAQRLAELPGDFGFVRFRADGSATAVSACAGLVPFYLRSGGGRAGIATRLEHLVRHWPEGSALDPLVNAVWTTGLTHFPDGRTFISGVSVLGLGGYARIEPDGRIDTGSYWSPRPGPSARPEPADEHAQRLRALLISRLERDLDPGGGNLLTLSGGVDSCSLGALAAGTVGRPVWSLSLVPAPPDTLERELGYIGSLGDRFGFGRRWSIVVRAPTRIELLKGGPRTCFQVMHPALNALPRILREAEVRVLFGGEFADEICGSHFTMPDWIRETSPLALLRGLRRLPQGPRDVLSWGKQRLLAIARRPRLPFVGELPELVRPELREEYREWLDRRRREAAADPGPLRHLALRTELHGFVAMNWEGASHLGVRRSIPFFGRELLELAFECHPAELVGPGTKRLLRAALAADVPHEFLHRPDKGNWGAYLQRAELPWERRLPESLSGVVRQDWFPAPPPSLRYTDAGALTQLVALADDLAALGTRPGAEPAGVGE